MMTPEQIAEVREYARLTLDSPDTRVAETLARNTLALLAHLDAVQGENTGLRNALATIAGSFGCDELTGDPDALAQAMIAHSGTYDLLHDEVQQYRRPTPEMVERLAQEIWGGDATPSGYVRPWRERYTEWQHDGLLALATRALAAALGCQSPVVTCGDGEQENEHA